MIFDTKVQLFRIVYEQKRREDSYNLCCPDSDACDAVQWAPETGVHCFYPAKEETKSGDTKYIAWDGEKLLPVGGYFCAYLKGTGRSVQGFLDRPAQNQIDTQTIGRS